MHLRHLESPLEIRASYRRLRKCKGRRKVLFQLLFPIPWHFATPTPSLPSDHDLTVENPLPLNILMLRHIPLYRWRDTPLRSLYRLYEDIYSGDLVLMGYESDYFFYHERWEVSQIPDPRDEDAIRYAVLASMAEALVTAFNWKLELGLKRDGTHGENDKNKPLNLQTPPAWAAKVQPLPQRLRLRRSDTEIPDPGFLKRNIDAPMGYLYNV